MYNLHPAAGTTAHAAVQRPMGDPLGQEYAGFNFPITALSGLEKLTFAYSPRFSKCDPITFNRTIKSFIIYFANRCLIANMAAALAPGLLYSQLFVTPPVPTKGFNSQTVIVTGSNTGLGLEAARHFVRLNAEKVILAVRSPEKGEAAKKSIEESTKRLEVVEVWRLDMGSYASVKEFAKKADTLNRIDVLLLNTGVSLSTYEVCEDNEATITINVVSTLLLALLLVPKLGETASTYATTPHISIVTSELHYLAAFKERDSRNIIQALNENHDLAER